MLKRENNIKILKAFTILELLVVISIIAILVSIMMPSLNRARSQARAVICKSNLKNLYIADMYYAADFDDWLPSKEKTVKLGGSWPFRAVKGYRSPTELDGLSEKYGLNALFNDLKYISSESDVWICPDLGMKWMADYGCCYSFSIAPNLSKYKFSVLAKKSPSSILIWDNVTHYPPAPTGWYLNGSLIGRTIPDAYKKEPHRYLAKKKKNEYGETVFDYDTWMMAAIDGWVGHNFDNKDRR